jgi:hypothetical protein
MADTVHVTFQYALGQRVCWMKETRERWRILERWYLEGQEHQTRRYLLITARDTWTAMAEESELSPLEDRP